MNYVYMRLEERSRFVDVNISSRAAMGTSDHYLTVARVKVKGSLE